MDFASPIPIEMKAVPCRHGDSLHAVGRYRTPEGCACFPEDREQDLCGQHVIKGGMLGNAVELIIIYDPEFYEKVLRIQ